MNLLKNGKFLLLLDGLDEVKQNFYEDCIYDVRDLIQHHASNRYIISCRENRYFGKLDSYIEKLKIQPLEREQINAYLKNYCQQFYPYQISNDQYSLLANPLLLTLSIEVINENQGSIPANKSILFRKYINYLLNHWDKKKGFQRDNPLSSYELVAFWGKLSFEFFEDPVLTTLELQKVLKREFPDKDIHSVFEQIINIGIFRRKSDDEIVYCHKTFLEYFAAQYIVGQIEKGESFDHYIPLIRLRTWHEVFIFCAGLIQNWSRQNEFLDCVLDNNIKLYVYCIGAKHDFNDLLLELEPMDYAIKYLELLGASYERIIDVYFSKIKSLLVPYSGLVENQMEGNRQNQSGRVDVRR